MPIPGRNGICSPPKSGGKRPRFCGIFTCRLEDRLIPNPIHKVLSTLSIHAVRHLLMGGQACVFYGAAEFSKDCDVMVLVESQSLQRL